MVGISLCKTLHIWGLSFSTIHSVKTIYTKYLFWACLWAKLESCEDEKFWVDFVVLSLLRGPDIVRENKPQATSSAPVPSNFTNSEKEFLQPKVPARSRGAGWSIWGLRTPQTFISLFALITTIASGLPKKSLKLLAQCNSLYT